MLQWSENHREKIKNKKGAPKDSRLLSLKKLGYSHWLEVRHTRLPLNLKHPSSLAR